MNTPDTHTLKPITDECRREEDLAAALMIAHLSDYHAVMELLQQGESQEAFLEAAEQGYVDIVELLLPYVNPKARDSAALYLAAMNGHADVVRLLLPVSDPKANDSAALWHAEIIAMLEAAIAAQEQDPEPEAPVELRP